MESWGTFTPEAAVTAVAALDEPARRRLYQFVSSQSAAVSRDEAASATRMARQTAAFHLDKLADVGLLAVEFARRTGRRGPGAGRPAKLYRRSETQFDIQLPQRSYELAGELLAQSVESAEHTGGSPQQSLHEHASAMGRAVGVSAGPHGDRILGALTRCGYEPIEADEEIVLANCPFHALAERHTDLVCGMNLHLIQGVLEGAGFDKGRARLEPHVPNCCVRIASSDTR